MDRIKALEKLGPKYSYVKHSSIEGDYPIINAITQEVFDSAVAYSPDDDDTFVVTYPKCGTTWINEILYLMRNDGRPVADGDNIANHYPFFEYIGKDATKQTPRPRYIKTHLNYEMVPWNPKAKYICVGRNPKSVVVSFYYHTIGYPKFYEWPNGKFDDYFELFINGRCDWGDYFTMVPKWHEQSQKQDNVHFMLFEDMKMNMRGELLKLADFLGESWKEKLLKNNEELLKKVIELSTFSSMKKEEDKFHYVDMRKKGIPFLRSGEIDDWKHLLTKEQSARIDEKMQEAEKHFPGFNNLWSPYQSLLNF